MTKVMVMLGLLLIAVIFGLIGRGGGPDLSHEELTWSYTTSPSGKCYEIGTYYRLGGYSYVVSSPVEDSYCK